MALTLFGVFRRMLQRSRFVNRVSRPSDLIEATFAGGCFWCTEAAFQIVPGVFKIRPGFTGGTEVNPDYYSVAYGLTSHTEAIRFSFDPEQVTYPELLALFFAVHDPYSSDRQGPDVGSMYRPVVFFHSQYQKECAEQFVNELNSEAPCRTVKTAIEPATPFYDAGKEHLEFYRRNRGIPYCRINIDPKISKVANILQNRNR